MSNCSKSLDGFQRQLMTLLSAGLSKWLRNLLQSETWVNTSVLNQYRHLDNPESRCNRRFFPNELYALSRLF